MINHFVIQRFFFSFSTFSIKMSRSMSSSREKESGKNSICFFNFSFVSIFYFLIKLSVFKITFFDQLLVCWIFRKEKDKLGGQHKIPRLSNSRDYMEELLHLLLELRKCCVSNIWIYSNWSKYRNCLRDHRRSFWFSFHSINL